MSVIKDSAQYYVEETDTHFLIEGVKLEFFKELLPGVKHLVIRAYELIVASDIILNGRNVEIIAAKMTFSPGVKIDVSGEPGASHGLAARSGINFGENGADGKKGNRGGDSGKVRIYAGDMDGILEIYANGGSGGPGQDGGNGVQGARGSTGSDDSINHNGPRGGSGGTGHQGGAAGKGGKGGDGGNAGKVDVRFIRMPKKGQIRIIAKEGPGGSPGRDGNPGAGGPGGFGGRKRHCDRHERVFEPDMRPGFDR